MCTIQEYKCSIYRPQIVNEKSSKLIARINGKINSNNSGGSGEWMLRVMDIHINNLFVTNITPKCE